VGRLTGRSEHPGLHGTESEWSVLGLLMRDCVLFTTSANCFCINCISAGCSLGCVVHICTQSSPSVCLCTADWQDTGGCAQLARAPCGYGWSSPPGPPPAGWAPLPGGCHDSHQAAGVWDDCGECGCLCQAGAHHKFTLRLCLPDSNHQTHSLVPATPIRPSSGHSTQICSTHLLPCCLQSAMLLGTIPVVWFCLWMLILIRGSMLSTGKSSLSPAQLMLTCPKIKSVFAWPRIPSPASSPRKFGHIPLLLLSLQVRSARGTWPAPSSVAWP
jgi:hypothetical protein